MLWILCSERLSGSDCRMKTGSLGYCRLFVLMSVIWAVAVTSGIALGASSDVVGGAYRPDTPFPEYMPLWREGWRWTDEHGQRVRYAHEGMPLGGYVQVYVRNDTSRRLEIGDVLLDGVNLTRGIAPESSAPRGKYASSIQFSKLPADEIDRLTRAGEPVWWKVDPTSIPPGGMAEVTVRLRRDPAPESLDVRIVAGDTTFHGTVPTRKIQPRIRSISFSPGLDKAFLYLRHRKGGGMRPSRILVDGEDLTDRASIVVDEKIDTVPVVVDLGGSLPETSFHCFQAVYRDGSSALAAIRVWEPDFKYGMWGIPKEGNSPEERARKYIERLHDHSINVIMSSYGGDVRKFVASEEGRRLCSSLGMRIMDHTHGSFDDPLYYYLPDEPDASDFNSRNINPPGHRLGSLAQWVIQRGEELRRKDPDTLLLCNIDNTYKPEQWYMYAQLPDVISADPYYPEQLRSVYRFDPTTLGAYTKPTYVYAVGKIYLSAGAPKPMHLILHTCRFDMAEDPFRAPTPEEKRVEVYYALAAGAKGISYWWYTPAGRYHGCGSRAPEMVSLLTEIGLLGAEVRTAGPVITNSCPVTAPIKAPAHLWVRSLLSGLDSLVLVVVNDNIACDRMGMVVKPVENAEISVDLPSWLKPRDVFAITHGGTREARWESTDSGISLDLGTVELTRLIVVSSDATLRRRLQGLYESEFASNVARLTATGSP